MAPQANLGRRGGLVGPYKGLRSVAVHATNDVEDTRGFTVANNGSAIGDLVVRTLRQGPDGADQTFPVAAGAALAGPGGIPVAVIAVRSRAGGTTATALLIGEL